MCWFSPDRVQFSARVDQDKMHSLVIFSFFVGLAVAAPNGAPAAACSSMVPQHGVQAQTGASPYISLPLLVMRCHYSQAVVIIHKVMQEF